MSEIPEKTDVLHSGQDSLLHDARLIIVSAQLNAVRSVEFHLVEMYWKLGERIVFEEQREKDRAEYGSYLIANLAITLEQEFGIGFAKCQLERSRQFYRLFPIASVLRLQLNWFQYRLLISIPDINKREYYELKHQCHVDSPGFAPEPTNYLTQPHGDYSDEIAALLGCCTETTTE